MFPWSQFEWLAANLVSDTSGGYIVKVFNKGGTYSMDDCRYNGQGEDNGKTLCVFNTNEDVVLTKTSSGRQFGPSVLAPFSVVTLDGSAGYLDGCVVAKEFGPSSAKPVVSNPDALQMHGDCYSGPFKCKV